jgi:hypothetical protein
MGRPTSPPTMTYPRSLVTTLRRASTTTALRSSFPQSDDVLGQAAYMAAALRGLAEAVAVLQGTAAEPSRAAK